MERLTRRINGVVVYVGAKNPYSTGQIPCEVEPAGVREMMDCRAAYEDTGLEPEAIETVKLALAAKHMVDLETLNNTPISRLVELAEADKDGHVIILPCKVYETDGAMVYEHTVCEVIYETAGGPAFDKNAIGKRIFSTRAEAERAMEGKKDG